MDYNGANSIFLRTLLDKKYALPYQAVDAVVYHFLRYALQLAFSADSAVDVALILCCIHCRNISSSAQSVYVKYYDMVCS